jgi:ubiquinone/menaquinone biosynthesis C-methylase UbiE
MPTTFTTDIKRDWVESDYYNLAEGWMEPFWRDGTPFRDCFNRLDHSQMVELACGRGRHAAQAVKLFDVSSITLVDINQSNIDSCKERFAGDSRFSFVVNEGADLRDVASTSKTSLFCYDAMVHFEFHDVIAYIPEIFRVLVPGGCALLHHSNNEKFPGNRYSQNSHWRNFMSARVMAHISMRAGFAVLFQKTIPWGNPPEPDLDCITLLQRPAA